MLNHHSCRGRNPRVCVRTSLKESEAQASLALTMTELSMLSRPRRNRKTAAMRALHRQTQVLPSQLIYPLFVHESDEDEAIASMPGAFRRGVESLVQEVQAAQELGIGAVVLFPKVPEAQKSPKGDACWDPAGLIPRTITQIKSACPDMTVVTDVALDPYSSDGHDGIVAPDGRILNDETIAVLCKQALCQARSGADIIAPSDMMDGRIGAIRRALDEEGFQDVSLMSYTAKYASAFYGPFRDALDSAPKAGDKKTYQMDPSNRREALREATLDEAEGADILMVKPAGAYLDIISDLRRESSLPIAAYQVSGEYAMLKAAVERGWLDEVSVAYESLLAIRRAGADMILTYYAKQIAQWTREGRYAAM